MVEAETEFRRAVELKPDFAEVGIGQMVLEGLRRLDEWSDLDRRYPSESALLAADGSVLAAKVEKDE